MICEYCGSLIVPAEAIEARRAALEEFHQVLQQQPRDRQARMLRSGYLPPHRELLIDAGVRCMALIVDEDVNTEPSLSARERLGSIVTRLKLESPDDQVRTAIREFEERITKHRRSDFWYTVLGLAGIGAIAAVILWLLV